MQSKLYSVLYLRGQLAKGLVGSCLIVITGEVGRGHKGGGHKGVLTGRWGGYKHNHGGG